MRRSLAGRLWPNIVAVVLFVFFVFPVYWMVTTAFKPDLDIVSSTPVFFPVHATFAHFTKAVHAPGFWTFVRNSFTVTLGAVLLSLIVATLSAFAVARMRFKGRKAFILMIMMAQMAPWEVLTISVYLIVRDSDALNSLLPLTLFYMMMVLPFTVWTLRGFIAAVPKELEEAALVDGCTRFQAFIRVVLPLLAPGLMATSLFGYITAWNEYALVLILNKDSGATLTLWLTEFQTNFGDDWGATMAAASLFTLPVVVVFLIMQRRAGSGMTAGAVKG
ncbi:carbohydrate ABC transporter permease [Streptomyces fuscigenes]|uniref:carbohydrate ABC transporter permease n=1 Tax=Streptomyces fuscigenes TaxID=1528880 RepID=UPI001F47A678|nr:carbohydrate ABC transporter permease [Streptomyces fuscigenes]MCF3963212.1 carbohydrate ABC transporter permease [Streptomyces fuscigenes]